MTNENGKDKDILLPEDVLTKPSAKTKLSDMLDWIGKPQTYYPDLVPLFGSLTATVLFCQIFYWMRRGEKPDEIYKSAAELTAETGLTYEEQRTARKRLESLGVIKTRYARLEHRTYYKINLQALDDLWYLKQEQVLDKLKKLSPDKQPRLIRVRLMLEASRKYKQWHPDFCYPHLAKALYHSGYMTPGEFMSFLDNFGHMLPPDQLEKARQKKLPEGTEYTLHDPFHDLKLANQFYA